MDDPLHESLASVKQLLREGKLINLDILQVRIQSFLHRKHYLVIKKYFKPT